MAHLSHVFRATIALLSAVVAGCSGTRLPASGEFPIGTVAEFPFDSLLRRADSTVLEETEAAPIGGIINIASGRGGVLYAADFRMRDVKAYDRQGRFLRSVGRQGQGPGEYIAPVYVTTDGEGDRVAVVDIAQYRVAVFDASGAGVVDHQVQSPVSLHSAIFLTDSTFFLGGVDRHQREEAAYGGAILAPPDRLIRQVVPIPDRLRSKALSGSVLYGVGSRGKSLVFLALNADGVIYRLDPGRAGLVSVLLPESVYQPVTLIERDRWVETPTAMQEFMSSQSWITSLQALDDTTLVVEVSLPTRGPLPTRRLLVLEWLEGRVDLRVATECHCRILGARGDTLAVEQGHEEPVDSYIIEWRVVHRP